jgi:hypothetical protein
MNKEEAKKRAANYMSLKGVLESKNSQYVDFSNPNADKITSGTTTTNKPMKNRKQTAVEWLLENAHIIPKFELSVQDIFEEAKAMEQLEIYTAYETGWVNGDLKKAPRYGKDYYNKIHKLIKP